MTEVLPFDHDPRRKKSTFFTRFFLDFKRFTLTFVKSICSFYNFWQELKRTFIEYSMLDFFLFFLFVFLNSKSFLYFLKDQTFCDQTLTVIKKNQKTKKSNSHCDQKKSNSQSSSFFFEGKCFKVFPTTQASVV